VFFLPSGRVHAIGKGIFLAEVQQSCDVTYRMYDYNRKDAQGKCRSLHVEEARDAIDYTLVPEIKTHYQEKDNEVVPLIRSSYFSTNRIRLTKPIEIQRSYLDIDSFVLLVCMGGDGYLRYEDGVQPLRQGTTVLLPAVLKNIVIGTDGDCLLMEVFV
jgi:mannose-6-phosphate isomerase